MFVFMNKKNLKQQFKGGLKLTLDIEILWVCNK